MKDKRWLTYRARPVEAAHMPSRMTSLRSEERVSPTPATYAGAVPGGAGLAQMTFTSQVDPERAYTSAPQ